MSKTGEQLKKEWVARIEKYLLGRKITKIEYLTDKECDDAGWYSCPVAIQLDGEIWLTPMSDDEGNNGGAISTNIKELQIIPVI